MTNLTEQWKKGKLDHGWYYIKYRGAYKTDQWQGYYWENSWNENVEEVIAPVPSYEEFDNITKCYLCAHEKADRLEKENQQLKGLLKECREKSFEIRLALSSGKINDTFDLTYQIENKIDNTIGEKK